MARRLIARAWLGDDPEPSRLGRFALRPEQRELVGRVRRALGEFGGALVVDPPGSGKTIVALAVARQYADTLVVAPATLRTQWARSAARAGVSIRFASVEALSRGRTPIAPALLVVDEAHHARSPGTARYRALTRLSAHAETLLLTATPVVNRRDDLDALLSLWMGGRAARLARSELARCVLRGGARTAGKPRVRRLPPIEAGVSPDRVAQAIRALPPPLAIADGGEATALIRMSLALAWSSSLAALDRTLARRLQRGEALRDLLRAGRAPTHAALRHWALGERATQLAFAEIVAPPSLVASCAGGADPSASDAVLAAHLDAVRALRRRLRDHVDADAGSRASAITTLACAHPDRRIVVFARHAETIRVLQRSLRAEWGVVAITGRRVIAAAGRWTRDEILTAVGPRAAALDADDPRAIRILLATDLLAEGVEMPGIGILVHGDLPWTPARLTQRRGRVARPGGSRSVVLETSIAAPAAAREIVQMESRLGRKRRAGRAALHDASVRTRLAALLRQWAALEETAPITCAIAEARGFVAAVRIHGETLLVVGSELATGGPWCVSTRAAICLRVCASVLAPEVPASPSSAHVAAPDEVSSAAVREARRRIARFIIRRAARAILGGSRLRAGDALARLARRVERAIVGARLAERPRIAELQRRLLALAAGGRGAGLDADAATLLREDLEWPALAGRIERLLEGQRVLVQPVRSQRPRLVALLILRLAVPLDAEGPPGAAHSSAAPGSVAPR